MFASHGGSPSGLCEVLGRPEDVVGRLSGELRFWVEDVRFLEVPETFRCVDDLRAPDVGAPLEGPLDFGGEEEGDTSDSGRRASSGVRGMSSSSMTCELMLRLRGRISGMPVPLLVRLRGKGESRSMMIDGTGTGLCLGIGILVPLGFEGRDWIKYCLVSCSEATSSGVRSSKLNTSSSSSAGIGETTRCRFMSWFFGVLYSSYSPSVS
jgi:hypothetical protein